jgi:hypothetical protein
MDFSGDGDKDGYGCYQAAEMYRVPMAECFKAHFAHPRREDFHGWLDPRATNYTLGISAKGHQPATECRSVVRAVVVRGRSDVAIRAL